MSARGSVWRFWSKVDQRSPEECWLWLAAKRPSGYGLFRVSRCEGVRGAHRVAWALRHGRHVPRGLVVMHACDNPPCCNPRHLSIGSQRDNIHDAQSKGRLPVRDTLFKCASCARQLAHHGLGLCVGCYQRTHRAELRREPRACASCARMRPRYARQMCRRCYDSRSSA